MRTRLTSLLLAGLLAILGTGVVVAGSADITVEGGAFFDFVAPDPLGPTDGAIRFGFTGTVETIAADAELVPPVDTNLSGFGGGTPTCLEVTREGGVITRLAFVAECLVEGEVTIVEDLFGPDADAYMIGDRLAAPAEFIATSPEFAALIGVPEAAGTVLSVTFTARPRDRDPGELRRSLHAHRPGDVAGRRRHHGRRRDAAHGGDRRRVTCRAHGGIGAGRRCDGRRSRAMAASR